MVGCNASTLKDILSGMQQVVERQLSAMENEQVDQAACDIENEAAGSDELSTSFDSDEDPFHEDYDDQDESFLPSEDECNDSSDASDSGIVNMRYRQNSENKFDGAHNNAQNQISEATTSGATINAIEHSEKSNQIYENQSELSIAALNQSDEIHQNVILFNAQTELNAPNRIGVASTSSAASNANKHSKKSKQIDAAFNGADKQSDELNVNDIVSTNARPVKEKVVWKHEPTEIFTDEEAFNEYVKENHWGTTSTVLRKKCVNRYMRCTRTHYKGPECAARLVVRMPTDDVKWLVFENNKAHDHNEVKTKIQPEVRKKVETLQSRNLKPATIAEILDVEFGSDAPKQNQIYNIIRQTKKLNKANYSSVSDVAEWVGKHETSENDDDAFVLDFRATGPSFQYIVSTRRLLKISIDFRIVACDATYKINEHQYPVILIGGIDENHKLHIFAYSITTSEQTENYAFAFNAWKNSVWQLFQQTCAVKVLIADAAGAITNGFVSNFTNGKVVMCYFHVMQNIEKNLKKKLLQANRDAILKDIRQIHLSPSREIFERASTLFTQKWQDSEPEFCQYFMRQWVYSNCGWYEGFVVNCPSTNNAMEGFNSFLKRCVTHRALLPLGSFNDMMFRYLAKKSTQYQHEGIAKEKTIQNEWWRAAVGWTETNLGMISINENITTSRHFILSTKSPESEITPTLRNKYLRMESDDLDNFIALMTSMYVVEFKHTQWKMSTCTCAFWSKHGVCKHVIGIAIIYKETQLPPEANNEKLRQRKKHTHRRLAEKALQAQPDFPAIIESTIDQLPTQPTSLLPKKKQAEAHRENKVPLPARNTRSNARQLIPQSSSPSPPSSHRNQPIVESPNLIVESSSHQIRIEDQPIQPPTPPQKRLQPKATRQNKVQSSSLPLPLRSSRARQQIPLTFPLPQSRWPPQRNRPDLQYNLPPIFELESSETEQLGIIEQMPFQSSSPAPPRNERSKVQMIQQLPSSPPKSSSTIKATSQPLQPKNTRSKRAARELPASALPANKKRKQCSPQLISFGGFQSSESLKGQSLVGSEWSILSIPKSGTINGAANCAYAHHNGEILISGGVRGANLKRAVLVDLREKKFRKIEAMKTARCAHASMYFADTYFVAGGKSVNDTLDTVEK